MCRGNVTRQAFARGPSGDRLGLAENLTNRFGNRWNRSRGSDGDEAEQQGVLDKILTLAVTKKAS